MKNTRNLLGVLVVLLLIWGVIGYQRRMGGMIRTSSVAQFSPAQVALLPDVATSTIIELKSGDTYTITAENVKKTIAGSVVRMIAYNGQIPGPTIKVAKGAEITINFVNHTDLPATIHSHGVRLANAFDGVPGVTQKPVEVGASFQYKIKFPDEGVYWYHPHIREDYEQELGLAGNFLVQPDLAESWEPVNREIPLMVDDLLMSGTSTAPFGSIADHALMGRFGNVMLVNGTDAYVLPVKQGEVIRFFVTNTANTRVFNLAIPGAKMKLVGGDNGRYEHESFVDEVLLSPSERAIVDVYFPDAGTFPLEHRTPVHTYTMGTFLVSQEHSEFDYHGPFAMLRANQGVITSMDPFRAYLGKSADKNLVLSVDVGSMGMGGSHLMHGGGMMMNGSMNMSDDDEKIEWEDSMAMMNDVSTANVIKWQIIDKDTRKVNDRIDWKFKVGDKVKMSIYNDLNSPHPMQHPFHIHGQRFLVLATNGIPNTNMVWKDTTLIQKGDTVDIVVDMENPGTWMAHCHIAEHLESGMMFGFTVTP